ncbi:hypothetical protein LI216_12210 [Mediterraneibacter glycyrrhizinilyticus]|uniref:hypothetical protein n=1 Tax=Mediterraneibacter glycyrrhizinilyticus TaxID=342942 RepID=UPI001D073953|nr:hypothetical protein [Mediterraneibacter glycyrrhizinilyticus]MCB6310328.1 hypothetical protein [Lachnospiraceae bacterium 210521-DFI.1.109]MCB6427828.1 hypothetical protein [Mediterraneibacter glycyrrhizinilyticus]
MSWANKAHKRIEKQKADEKYGKDLRNALDLFFLITADYLHRYEGYSKKRLIRFIDFAIEQLHCAEEDSNYFLLMNEALCDETGVNVLKGFVRKEKKYRK